LFHPFYFPSVFTQYFSPFLSLSLLSFRYIHSTCAQFSLSPHSTFYTFFSLLPNNTCFLSPRHHFSFSCTLSPQVFRNLLCHTPLILPVLSGFFYSLPSFLLVCVFLPFTQLYTHPFSFCSQSFHFFTLSLSAYSSCTLPSLCNLAFLCPFLAPLSNIFLALSLPSPVPSIPRSLPPVHQYTLKHHHSPPEVTSPLSVSYSPNTSHYLICLPHYLSDMCLIRGSFPRFELASQFYFPSFPVPLILFTLFFFLLPFPFLAIRLYTVPFGRPLFPLQFPFAFPILFTLPLSLL
jgi:hypothetical protein